MNGLRWSLIAVALLSLGCWRIGAQDRGQAGLVREMAVAGQFYPAEAAAARQALDFYLADALPPHPERPVALVVPHAGWAYSAQIAADGFRQAAAHKYDTIVVLGTAHTAAVRGRVSVYPGAGLRTPFGTIELDRPLADALVKRDSIFLLDASAHASEHSIEVQLPFIRYLFPNAKVLAAVVATDDPAACVRAGRALAGVLEGRQALIVASSDLAHYPSAADAARVDRRTLEAMASMNPSRFSQAVAGEMQRGVPNLVTAACGEAPVLVAMSAAASLGATGGRVISHATSDDIAVGESERAVGYGSVVFSAGWQGADVSALVASPQAPPTTPLTPEDKQVLLRLSRETLRRYLSTQTLPLLRGFDARLQQDRGVFVTLKKRGDLRGCIGRIEGGGPVAKMVSQMSLESALNDPRFEKVTIRELDSLEIEISVLTPLRQVPRAEDIVVGRDGVVIRKAERSAVFLPQVAPEQGWNRDEMLDNLSLKAGLPASAWRAGTTFWTFQADVFHEGQFKK